MHTEWDNGAMDGFVVANNHNNNAPADGKRAMGYYTEQDLPCFYSLANTFALADHNFSSVIGPTFPNREYLYAATSFGHIGNDLVQRREPDHLPGAASRPRSIGASTTPICRAASSSSAR